MDIDMIPVLERISDNYTISNIDLFDRYLSTHSANTVNEKLNRIDEINSTIGSSYNRYLIGIDDKVKDLDTKLKNLKDNLLSKQDSSLEVEKIDKAIDTLTDIRKNVVKAKNITKFSMRIDEKNIMVKDTIESIKSINKQLSALKSIPSSPSSTKEFCELKVKKIQTQSKLIALQKDVRDLTDKYNSYANSMSHFNFSNSFVSDVRKSLFGIAESKNISNNDFNDIYNTLAEVEELDKSHKSDFLNKKEELDSLYDEIGLSSNLFLFDNEKLATIELPRLESIGASEKFVSEQPKIETPKVSKFEEFPNNSVQTKDAPIKADDVSEKKEETINVLEAPIISSESNNSENVTESVESEKTESKITDSRVSRSYNGNFIPEFKGTHNYTDHDSKFNRDEEYFSSSEADKIVLEDSQYSDKDDRKFKKAVIAVVNAHPKDVKRAALKAAKSISELSKKGFNKAKNYGKSLVEPYIREGR